MDLKKHIRSIPDYPKKGILFRDITTLIKDAKAFKYTNDKIIDLAKKIEFDKVAAIESRGFVFASAVSYKLEKPFILLRKKKRTPPKSKIFKIFKIFPGCPGWISRILKFEIEWGPNTAFSLLCLFKN